MLPAVCTCVGGKAQTAVHGRCLRACRAKALAPGGPETMKRNIFQFALRGSNKASTTDVVNTGGRGVEKQETLLHMQCWARN